MTPAAHEARQEYDYAQRLVDLCGAWDSQRRPIAAEILGRVAAVVQERDEARAQLEQMREAGQALRDAFPDSSWQASRERADAADDWDALAAIPDPEEPRPGLGQCVRCGKLRKLLGDRCERCAKAQC